MKVFTKDLDNRLIDLVRCRPALYDRRDSNWKNTAAREKMWTAIAKELGRKAIQCKSRWKSIRDSYKKVKTKMKAKGDNCSEKDLRSKYSSDKFAFLDVILEEEPARTGPYTLIEGYEENDPKVYVFEESFNVSDDGNCVEETIDKREHGEENTSGEEASDKTSNKKGIDDREENGSDVPTIMSSFSVEAFKEATKRGTTSVVKGAVERKAPTIRKAKASSSQVEADDESEPQVYVFEQSFNLAEDGSYRIEGYDGRDQELHEDTFDEDASGKMSPTQLMDVEEENVSEIIRKRSSRRVKAVKDTIKTDIPSVVKDIVESKVPTLTVEHPVESFFRSMAQTVMGFSPDLIAEARLKVCQVVTAIEIKDLQRKQHF